VTSAVAQFYGARPLKPERSTNFGAGIVFNPSSAFTATIDWYQINVRDRIFVSQNFFVTGCGYRRFARTGLGRCRRRCPVLQ